MTNPRHPDHDGCISRLCPELRTILDAELVAGNQVVEAWDGYGSVVLLAKPFVQRHEGSPGKVEFHEVNDPHYWKAEWRSLETDQVLACRF